MTKEEFDEMVRQMKEHGLTVDDIMTILLETVVEEKAGIDDLELMAGWLGFEIDRAKVEKIVELKRKEKKADGKNND